MLTMLMVFMSLIGVEVPEEKESPEMSILPISTPDYSYVKVYSNMDHIRY